ncbi:hypothetical protein [Mycobacterium malmoense]|uniref:hypothetical protein n=1 Tax=Mycobacterium malmoense TaxID=1780 RepID=UPI0008F8B3D9|nr:hypothetical protein [Mycobacterium malmoense]OIN80642.1 hypothetical protein BMG05_11585 [Mycobacterium malmoense]
MHNNHLRIRVRQNAAQLTAARATSQQFWWKPKNAITPNAIAAVTKLLTGHGYADYVDVDDSRRPIEKFDWAEHQHPANVGSRNGGLGGPRRLCQRLRLHPDGCPRVRRLTIAAQTVTPGRPAVSQGHKSRENP